MSDIQLYYQRQDIIKIRNESEGAVNTNTPAQRENPQRDHQQIIKEDGRGVSGSHTNLHPEAIWNYNYMVEN